MTNKVIKYQDGITLKILGFISCTLLTGPFIIVGRPSFSLPIWSSSDLEILRHLQKLNSIGGGQLSTDTLLPMQTGKPGVVDNW